MGRTGLTRILMDRAFDAPALRRRETLLGIVTTFDPHYPKADALTIAAEVFANAVRHGAIQRLGVVVRQRGDLLLLVFHHCPVLTPEAVAAFERAGSGWLPDDASLGAGGLGLPILHRIPRRLTLSDDRARLCVWLPIEKLGTSPC